MALDLQSIEPLRQQLYQHPVYGAIRNTDDLAVFMEHHVYSVWDFMSLVKYLQHQVASTQHPWLPDGDAQVKRFITELVLEEECDEAPDATADAPRYASHFELYCEAMNEIGADTRPVRKFLELVRQEGIDQALQSADIPRAARQFSCSTFDFIQSGKPHAVAAALALGREHIIPDMFRQLLRDMHISKQQAPTFHYYLERHIHLDEGSHAPMSIRMLEMLCHNDVERQEAVQFAEQAIKSRIRFWDGVVDNLKKKAA